MLDPPWSTDWITPAGRRCTSPRHGIAPPGPAPHRPPGPAPLTLAGSMPDGRPPALRFGGHPGDLQFGSTACKASAPVPILRGSRSSTWKEI